MEDTLNKVAEKSPVFAITSRLPHEKLISPEGAGGHPDPHVWMDVAAWANCLDVVVEGLSKSEPAHSDEFRSRADALRQTLQALHEYGLTSVASIPEERRVLVTSGIGLHMDESDIVYRVPDTRDIDVRAIRQSMGMTQEQFAAAFGLSVASLRNWEQGTRKPERPIALYLRLIARYPDEVRREIEATRTGAA